MNNWVLICVLLMLMAMAYQFGLSRSRSVAGASQVRMHSRPGYYGLLVALWCGLPALAVFLLWSLFEPSIIRSAVLDQLPAHLAGLQGAELDVLMRRIQQIASGFGVAGEPEAYELAAAERMRSLQDTGRLAMIASMAALGLAGLVYTLRRISPKLRARMPSMTSRVMLKTELRLVWITSSQCSFVMRWSMLSRVMPALLTRTSTGPRSRVTRVTPS